MPKAVLEEERGKWTGIPSATYLVWILNQLKIFGSSFLNAEYDFKCNTGFEESPLSIRYSNVGTAKFPFFFLPVTFFQRKESPIVRVGACMESRSMEKSSWEQRQTVWMDRRVCVCVIECASVCVCVGGSSCFLCRGSLSLVLDINGSRFWFNNIGLAWTTTSVDPMGPTNEPL